MKQNRNESRVLILPVLLLAIALISCGSTSGQPNGSSGDTSGVYNTSTPEVSRFLTTSLDEFVSKLSQAIVDRDFPMMETLMRDPLDINARGAGASRRQPSIAIEHLQRFYPPEGMDLECGAEPPETIGDDLAIGTANSLLNRDGELYCTGWGPDGTGQALLLIHLDGQGYYYWTVFAVSLQ